jgi:hypothetical protein
MLLPPDLSLSRIFEALRGGLCDVLVGAKSYAKELTLPTIENPGPSDSNDSAGGGNRVTSSQERLKAANHGAGAFLDVSLGSRRIRAG